jgi:NitT/TauT family transport system permease protein
MVFSALGLIAFLLFWEGVWQAGALNLALVPPPSHLPDVFFQEIGSGIWGAMLLSSLCHYLTGVVAGSFMGIAMAVWVGVSPRFRAFQEWVVRLLRPVPPLAWIPFAIIWFGVTTQAAAFMIAIGVFWLNYFATLSAVMAVDRDFLELAEAYGHRKFSAKLRKIILPGAAPGILGGIRSGLGQGWMLVVAAELFGVPGVGQRMMEAAGLLATDVVVVYMFTIAAVYSLTDWIYMRVESRVLLWQRT